MATDHFNPFKNIGVLGKNGGNDRIRTYCSSIVLNYLSIKYLLNIRMKKTINLVSILDRIFYFTNSGLLSSEPRLPFPDRFFSLLVSIAILEYSKSSSLFLTFT